MGGARDRQQLGWALDHPQRERPPGRDATSRSAASGVVRALAAPAHERVDDQADDRRDDQVVEHLQVVAPVFPFVADGLAEQAEAEHPGQRAERGQPGEAPEGHLRDPGRQRDEGADQGQEPGEEDGRVAVALEPAVDPGQTRRADVDRRFFSSRSRRP